MEKDDEVKGQGNSYTAAFWEYDPRLGRRWNTEPLMYKYPFFSPYSSFANNPIYNEDPMGDQPSSGVGRWYIQPNTTRIENDKSVTSLIYDHIDKQYWWINKDVNGNYKYYNDKPSNNIIEGKRGVGWYDFAPNADSYNPTPSYAAADKITNFFVGTTSAAGGAEAGIIGSALFNLTKQYAINKGDIKKIDLADAAIDLLPLKGIAGKIGADLLSAVTQYTDGKFSYLGNGIDLKEASIEFVSNAIASSIIGKYEGLIEQGFKDSDPQAVKSAVKFINKVATDYMKEALTKEIKDKTTSKKK